MNVNAIVADVQKTSGAAHFSSKPTPQKDYERKRQHPGQQDSKPWTCVLYGIAYAMSFEPFGERVVLQRDSAELNRLNNPSVAHETPTPGPGILETTPCP